MEFKHTPVDLKELKSVTTPGGRYYRDPEDKAEWYPSVTTVLNASADKTWLANWQQALGKSKAQKETERCAERGTKLHKVCEDYLNNKTSYFFKVPQDVMKLFNKIKMTLNKISNIHGLELPVYSKSLGFAGRSDCIAEFNKVLSIIDFKTSTSTKDESMIEDYFIQATMYALAYYELTGIFIENLVIIMAAEKSFVPLIFERNTRDYVKLAKTKIDAYYESIK